MNTSTATCQRWTRFDFVFDTVSIDPADVVADLTAGLLQ
jgi:hypothetical protein